MSKKVKDIDIKDRTVYFLNDIMNVKIFYPNNIKIEILNRIKQIKNRFN